MTVDLLGRMDEQMAIQEAAAAGLKGMEHLIMQLSSSAPGKQQLLQQQQQIDCREITDHTVSKFKKVISILNRTGHARFRRGPTVPFPAAAPLPAPEPVKPISVLPPPPMVAAAPGCGKSLTLDFTKPIKEGFSVSAASSSFLSSVTGDGSVSNGRQGGASSMLLPPIAPSSGKPPLCSSMALTGVKRKCHDHAHSENVLAGGNGGRCHCSKRSRKSRVKRTIRVPAISSKVADIPPDEYSWRKYGQKPIKGSPYPRGYYKCSTLRGCPARKHVERDPSDPSMLIVTYENGHDHSSVPTQHLPPPAGQPEVKI